MLWRRPCCVLRYFTCAIVTSEATQHAFLFGNACNRSLKLLAAFCFRKLEEVLREPAPKDQGLGCRHKISALQECHVCNRFLHFAFFSWIGSGDFTHCRSAPDAHGYRTKEILQACWCIVSFGNFSWNTFLGRTAVQTHGAHRGAKISHRRWM